MLGICFVFFLMFLTLILGSKSWLSGHLGYVAVDPKHIKPQVEKTLERLDRKDISVLLKDFALDPSHLEDYINSEQGVGARLSVELSIDKELQNYILSLLHRSRTVQSAVVALNPEDGRILAMVSLDKAGGRDNLCVKAEYPAASIFKIVSAAAALESAGFTPDQNVFFRGSRHTLYKTQLTAKNSRYVSKTSFRRAFASSINPVFGKLGIYSLGREVISDYAGRFYFNQGIPFDLPVGVSSISVPEDEYGLAEIASGFNRQTRISPLHAVLLAAAVANDGRIAAPWLVDRVSDESGAVLYERQPISLRPPIDRETAEDLRVLMGDTVLYGTARKYFQALRRKKVFKNIDLGAKTGTINNDTDELKFDWVTAYAIPRKGPKAICVAALSVHGEKLGIRSNEIAQRVINYFFNS